MVLQVFVSHNMSPQDWDIIQGLLGEAPGRNINYYLAERHPNFGHQLTEKIKAAIRQAHCVLVLWTRDGAHSEWVNQEVGFAEQLGRLIIPIVESGATPKGFLVGKEYISLDRADPEKTILAATEYLERIRMAEESKQKAALVVLGILGLLFLLSRE